MIIGLDISSIAYGTGVSNYTLNLVENLVALDSKNTYKLFFSSLRLPFPASLSYLKSQSNIKIYHYRFPPTLLHYLWNILHILPIEWLIGSCDIFHTSDWTQPPTLTAKTVTTIHDLLPFLHPSWVHPKIIATHQAKISQAIKAKSHFICVSQNTQKDLLSLFPQISPAQTSVIYEAAEEKYHLKSPLPPKNYLFTLGTNDPRRNLVKVIEGFSLFLKKHPDSTLELLIGGKFGWGQDLSHLSTKNIKILGYVPESDLAKLHSEALAFIYPSLYEGFGLSIIKSLSTGVPVITSNTSAIPEVVGQAGILVDPNSIDDIANAIEKITTNPSLRTQLSLQSQLQAKKFSWSLTAQQTLTVYLKIKN